MKFIKPHCLLILLASVGMITSSCATGVGKTTATGCDRSCLIDVTEAYLDAKARGSIVDIPLSDSLRVSSNSQIVNLGQGETWQTEITIVNRYHFVDAEMGSVIFFGTIAGKPAEKRMWWHYVLRLGVDANGKIFEIEEQSTTQGFQGAEQVEVPFKEAAIFNAVLPEAEQVSKAELIMAADSYWVALTSGDSKDVSFGPSCQRSEFGKYSTNRTHTHSRDADPDYVPRAHIGQSCGAFFDNEKFRWRTDNRRYYIVDQARGVVVGIGQLNQHGDDGNPGLTLFEAFKIVNGRIEFLWAPAFNWAVEDSGWPDWQRPN